MNTDTYGPDNPCYVEAPGQLTDYFGGAQYRVGLALMNLECLKRDFEMDMNTCVGRKLPRCDGGLFRLDREARDKKM